jgi:hypothetical protein
MGAQCGRTDRHDSPKKSLFAIMRMHPKTFDRRMFLVPSVKFGA